MDKNQSDNESKVYQSAREYIQHIEENAMLLRRQAGIGLLDRLNPRGLADQLQFRIQPMNDIEGLSPPVRQSLQSIDAGQWSGISSILPNNSLLIVLNPNMTVERENVTIMEEIAHFHYRHTPCLPLDQTGPVQRGYSKDQEKEAYWTAAAALLPSKAVGLAIYRGQTADDLAVRYEVSVELAEMRIKILGLWSHYNPSPFLPLRRAS